MKLRVRDLGLMSYDEAHAIQLETVAAVQAGDQEDTLLLVEHPPVITMGRNAESANVLLSHEALEAQGITLREIERGGDATYHGPGQLVGYPIFDLKKRHGRSIRTFVDHLEQIIIDYALEKHGLKLSRNPANAGVWLGDAKICAIGLAVKRGVTFHGFALNVTTNLEHFKTIVPCGLDDKRVSSLFEETHQAIEMQSVKEALAALFAKHFGFEAVDFEG